MSARLTGVTLTITLSDGSGHTLVDPRPGHGDNPAFICKDLGESIEELHMKMGAVIEARYGVQDHG